MAQPRYEEIVCQQALNRVDGMPFRWSLNPYRGCKHSCTYCFARATHSFFDLGPGDDFSSILFVKTNLPEVLASELGRRSWLREQVAIGTATDPYQPAEGTYRLTRRALELFLRYRSPVSIVTKGTLIVRDLDLLTRLAGEYERLYPRKYAPRWLQREVEARVQAERARLRPDERYPAPRAPPAAPLQLKLGL